MKEEYEDWSDQRAQEARGCGDGGCVFRAPSARGQHTNAGCRCLPLRMTLTERRNLRRQIRSLVVGLDEARAALSGVGVEQCRVAASRDSWREQALDAQQVAIDTEVRLGLRAEELERDLLRRLWQRIDGDQDGDAPSNQAMEDGLVRLCDEMRADVERCAADENASTQEAERLRAERDRLARILAVERGDESQAPEGWSRMEHVSGWRRRDRHGRGWTVRYARLGDDWHAACVYLDGIRVGAEHPTALEAMEAAEAARGVSDG